MASKTYKKKKLSSDDEEDKDNTKNNNSFNNSYVVALPDDLVSNKESVIKNVTYINPVFNGSLNFATTLVIFQVYDEKGVKPMYRLVEGKLQVQAWCCHFNDKECPSLMEFTSAGQGANVYMSCKAHPKLGFAYWADPKSLISRDIYFEGKDNLIRQDTLRVKKDDVDWVYLRHHHITDSHVTIDDQGYILIKPPRLHEIPNRQDKYINPTFFLPIHEGCNEGDDVCGKISIGKSPNTYGKFQFFCTTACAQKHGKNKGFFCTVNPFMSHMDTYTAPMRGFMTYYYKDETTKPPGKSYSKKPQKTNSSSMNNNVAPTFE